MTYRLLNGMQGMLDGPIQAVVEVVRDGAISTAAVAYGRDLAEAFDRARLISEALEQGSPLTTKEREALERVTPALEWLKENAPGAFDAPDGKFDPEFEPSTTWGVFARDMTLRSIAQRMRISIPAGPCSPETVKLLVITWAEEIKSHRP